MRVWTRSVFALIVILPLWLLLTCIAIPLLAVRLMARVILTVCDCMLYGKFRAEITWRITSC